MSLPTSSIKKRQTMAKKTIQQQSDQINIFHKAAQNFGCDESEERFDAAVKKIARHKPVPDPMPKDDPEALVEWGKRNIQKD
jgi:hypothetical protein